MTRATIPEEKLETVGKVSLSNILVTTDFSPESDRALDYAISLARRYDARIYMAHVISPDPFFYAEPALATSTYEKVRQAAELGIANILVSGKLRGIPHEVLLEEGNIWPVLQELIRKHEIDLLVTGTHGIGKMQKLLIGSVAEEIFRQADCAVLTVGPNSRPAAGQEVEYKNILFATDFGPGAKKAAAYAFSLAQEHGAQLIMFHAIQEPAGFSEDSVRRQKEFLIDRLKQLMPAGSEYWCKPEFRVSFGEAAEEILTHTREFSCGLIVMGTKTRLSLAGHSPVTIAYSVVTKAICPVLTVRG
jgi:nucleotide-binding universal stress UspA family protein